jgi:hypothetical protein
VFALWAIAPAAVLAQASPPARSKVPPAPALSVAQSGADAPTPAQTADEQVDLKVKTLEERVNDLKEKIFRTKARLMNLQEMVMGGDVVAGARAVLFHRNEMGSSFALESAAYALDGAPVYTKADVGGDLDKREEFEVFNGRIVPGSHQVGVKLVYRGHGYGLFSYLEGYRFKVQSSHTFNAEAGKVTVVKVVGYEKGGITTDLKDRPGVRYDVEVKKEEAGKKGSSPTSRPEAAPAPVPAAAAVGGPAR